MHRSKNKTRDTASVFPKDFSLRKPPGRRVPGGM